MTTINQMHLLHSNIIVNIIMLSCYVINIFFHVSVLHIEGQSSEISENESTYNYYMFCILPATRDTRIYFT